MTLTDAIALVLADNREQDPENTGTDTELLTDFRRYVDHDEVDSWAETELVERGSPLETAYRMVIDASAEDVAEALR